MSLFGVVLVRIQSECGKMWTRITPNTDTFHVVIVLFKNNNAYSKLATKTIERRQWRISLFTAKFEIILGPLEIAKRPAQY